MKIKKAMLQLESEIEKNNIKNYQSYQYKKKSDNKKREDESNKKQKV
jgi:hypothetical protein